MAFPRKETLLLQVMKRQKWDRDEAERFLENLIAYGPIMPICKRCFHAMCPHCETSCDVCVVQDRPGGTVDRTAELLDIDEATMEAIEADAKPMCDSPCVLSKEDGFLYRILSLTEAKRWGGPILASASPTRVWGRDYHSECGSACDIEVPATFEDEMAAWNEARKAVSKDGCGTSQEDEDGRVVGYTYPSMSVILQALGVETVRDLARQKWADEASEFRSEVAVLVRTAARANPSVMGAYMSDDGRGVWLTAPERTEGLTMAAAELVAGLREALKPDADHWIEGGFEPRSIDDAEPLPAHCAWVFRRERRLCGIPARTLPPCDLSWGHDGNMHANAGDGFWAREYEEEHRGRQKLMNKITNGEKP